MTSSTTFPLESGCGVPSGPPPILATFQEGQLRLFVLVRDYGLVGPGDELAAARARVAEAEYADFVDHAVFQDVIGGLLEPKMFETGVWRKFAPDFVYRTGRSTRRRLRDDWLRRSPSSPPGSRPGRPV